MPITSAAGAAIMVNGHISSVANGSVSAMES
jgi:hypothetical protein